MPSKYFHFSIGSSFGLVCVLTVFKFRHWLHRRFSFMKWLYAHERWWMLYSPFVIFVIGFWSLVPSLLFGFGLSEKWGKHPVADLFFFHRSIELWEDTLSVSADMFFSRMGQLLNALIYGGCFVCYILFIRGLKKQLMDASRHD